MNFFLKGILTTVSVVFLYLSPAMADVDYYPDWIYDQYAQYASWDYWNSDGSSNGWVEYTFNHDYGLTAPSYDTAYNTNTVETLYMGRDDVLLTDNAGSLVFHFDNYDTGGSETWVRLIVNFYAGEESYSGLDVVTIGVATENPFEDVGGGEFSFYSSNPGDELNYSRVGWTEQENGWIIAAYDFYIEPGPGEEWIMVTFGYDTDSQYTFYENNVYIDEALIHTRAIVPVPDSLWLFGAGLLSLLGLCRKKYHRSGDKQSSGDTGI